MARISASDAQTAAYKIVEPIQKKMVEIEEQIRTKVTEYVTAQVPADVMKVFKGANFEYIDTSNEVRLYEHGFNGRSVSMNGHVPIVNNKGNWNNPKFNLSKIQADAIQKLVDKKEKLKEKYDTTKQEVESSILTLGTHKRVLEEMPDAYNFLPGVSGSKSLMINIAPINAKIKCLISKDSDKKMYRSIIKRQE